MKLKDLEEQMAIMIPVIKVSEAKFLIGTELKQLEIRNSVIVVRVGGGYEPLQEYLLNKGKTHCMKLN